MDESKRLMITGWIDKASNHLDVAQEYLKSRCRASDAIQESQVCVELSVKSVLTILGIDFPKTHGWGEKELRKIAEDIQNRRLLVRLKDQSFHIRAKLRLRDSPTVFHPRSSRSIGCRA